MKKISVLL